MQRLILAAIMPVLVTAQLPAAEAGITSVQIARLTPKAEQAIDRGLRYLASQQNADGSWGRKYRPGMTGLALMAFMVKGYFPERGRYGDRLDKAVGYLLSAARLGGGYMGINMYEHGLATLALSEVWGMSDRKGIRDTLKQAVEVILRSQSKSGGWRYQPQPRDADISVTVMQIVALASAKEAGIHVPDDVIDRAKAYVMGLQEKGSGGFGYQRPSSPGFARTAAGVMSLLMCGERSSRAVGAGLTYLRRYDANKKWTGSDHYFYGHYYAIQAMYQAGEAYYQEWYPHIRDALLARQRSDGSWDRGHDVGYGTAMAILTLGVPYRFLPIYQR
jgi:squalene cyclase